MITALYAFRLLGTFDIDILISVIQSDENYVDDA